MIHRFIGLDLYFSFVKGSLKNNSRYSIHTFINHITTEINTQPCDKRMCSHRNLTASQCTLMINAVVMTIWFNFSQLLTLQLLLPGSSNFWNTFCLEASCWTMSRHPVIFFLMFCWPCIMVQFLQITNLMHSSFSYIFIPILYMFRAPVCSSSGESIVLMWHLVYVTLCRWPSSVQVWMELQFHPNLHTWRSPT